MSLPSAFAEMQLANEFDYSGSDDDDASDTSTMPESWRLYSLHVTIYEYQIPEYIDILNGHINDTRGQIKIFKRCFLLMVLRRNILKKRAENFLNSSKFWYWDSKLDIINNIIIMAYRDIQRLKRELKVYKCDLRMIS